MNAWVHTNTKPQISSTRSRGLGWRIHGSVEDTKLSTNKQHSLSPSVERLFSVAGQVVTGKRNSLHPSSVTLLVFLHEAIPKVIEREARAIIQDKIRVE